MSAAPLLELDGVDIEYRNGRRRFLAVTGVDLHIGRGEILGLVGESGSGKTTIGRSIVGLAPVTAGAVRFDGTPIQRRTLSERRALERRIQMVFQAPYRSLDPASPRSPGTPPSSRVGSASGSRSRAHSCPPRNSSSAMSRSAHSTFLYRPR